MLLLRLEHQVVLIRQRGLRNNVHYPVVINYKTASLSVIRQPWRRCPQEVGGRRKRRIKSQDGRVQSGWHDRCCSEGSGRRRGRKNASSGRECLPGVLLLLLLPPRVLGSQLQRCLELDLRIRTDCKALEEEEEGAGLRSPLGVVPAPGVRCRGSLSGGGGGIPMAAAASRSA
jgi:hypothetical protein